MAAANSLQSCIDADGSEKSSKNEMREAHILQCRPPCISMAAACIDGASRNLNSSKGFGDRTQQHSVANIDAPVM